TRISRFFRRVFAPAAEHHSDTIQRWRIGPRLAQVTTARMSSLPDSRNRPRGSICPRLALNFAPLNQRGLRENRMPAAPAALCAGFDRKAHKLHSPQGSTDIRFSLHDGRDAFSRALSVHRDPDRARDDRDTPPCGPERFGPIHYMINV